MLVHRNPPAKTLDTGVFKKVKFLCSRQNAGETEKPFLPLPPVRVKSRTRVRYPQKKEV